MTKYKLLGATKRLRFKNTLNNSSSFLLQISSQNSRVRKTTGNSLVMAFRKLKYRFLVHDIQRLVTIGILFATLGHVSADARKFQANNDISTNIITDPKSVASIDFR